MLPVVLEWLDVLTSRITLLFMIGECDMKYLIEIHAAEGGMDSCLFTRDLAQTYTKTFQRIG